VVLPQTGHGLFLWHHSLAHHTHVIFHPTLYSITLLLHILQTFYIFSSKFYGNSILLKCPFSCICVCQAQVQAQNYKNNIILFKLHNEYYKTSSFKTSEFKITPNYILIPSIKKCCCMVSSTFCVDITIVNTLMGYVWSGGNQTRKMGQSVMRVEREMETNLGQYERWIGKSFQGPRLEGWLMRNGGPLASYKAKTDEAKMYVLFLENLPPLYRDVNKIFPWPA
jgi:hypothetical protein